MSALSFWRDPVFCAVLIILSGYSFAGYRSARKNQMATPKQMIGKGQLHGIPWTGHLGFWSVTFVVHPVLAWATAKMWPLWQSRGDTIALFIIVGGVIGYQLQTMWSRGAGDSDAWSTDGRPNAAGVIHIQHMSVEIGIMLMLFYSALGREMPLPMFLGILAIIVDHFIIGSHWPLKVWRPDWRPEDMADMGGYAGGALVFITIILLGGGFYALSLV